MQPYNMHGQYECKKYKIISANIFQNLLNRIKQEFTFPEFMEFSNIVSIYKGKGERMDLENDRGIFVVTILRSILNSLIYKDKYNLIGSNMSGSQVGGRKGMNVRNHIWMLNGIISDVLSTKKKNPIIPAI